MNRILEDLKKKYPNDMQFGSKVREFVNNFSEDLSAIKTNKLQAIGAQEYEKAAKYRGEEKELLEKIRKKLDLD